MAYISVEEAMLAISGAVKPLDAQITDTHGQLITVVRLGGRAPPLPVAIDHRDATDAERLRERLDTLRRELVHRGAPVHAGWSMPAGRYVRRAM